MAEKLRNCSFCGRQFFAVADLKKHSAVCEKHPLYQCALVTEEGVDWVLEFDDSGTGPETILEDARQRLIERGKIKAEKGE